MGKYQHGDIIVKTDDTPFPTEPVAAAQRGMWIKRGVDTEVVEHDGGWALKVVVAGDDSVEKPARRPKRKPLGFRNVLTAPKEKGVVRRFVNDSEGRIAMFEDAGWEVVVAPGKAGDDYVGNTRLPGGAVTKPVGNGVVAVLMQKRKDWYDEDYQEKMDEIDRAEKGLAQRAQMDNLHVASGKHGTGIDIDRRMG